MIVRKEFASREEAWRLSEPLIGRVNDRPMFGAESGEILMASVSFPVWRFDHAVGKFDLRLIPDLLCFRFFNGKTIHETIHDPADLSVLNDAKTIG